MPVSAVGAVLNIGGQVLSRVVPVVSRLGPQVLTRLGRAPKPGALPGVNPAALRANAAHVAARGAGAVRGAGTPWGKLAATTTLTGAGTIGFKVPQLLDERNKAAAEKARRAAELRELERRQKEVERARSRSGTGQTPSFGNLRSGSSTQSSSGSGTTFYGNRNANSQWRPAQSTQSTQGGQGVVNSPVDVITTTFDQAGFPYQSNTPEERQRFGRALDAAYRYNQIMKQFSENFGGNDEDIRRFAFEVKAPETFKLESGTEIKPKLSDYYTAQSLMGQQIFNEQSSGLEQIFKDLGYDENMKKWALANPMLAQREYAKMLKSKGLPVPAVQSNTASMASAPVTTTVPQQQETSAAIRFKYDPGTNRIINDPNQGAG